MIDPYGIYHKYGFVSERKTMGKIVGGVMGTVFLLYGMVYVGRQAPEHPILVGSLALLSLLAVFGVG